MSKSLTSTKKKSDSPKKGMSLTAIERDLALAKKGASLKDLRLMKNDQKIANSLGRMVLSGPSNRLVYRPQFRPCPTVAKRERETKRLACASIPNEKNEQAKISSVLHLFTRKRLPIKVKETIGKYIKNNKFAGIKRRTYNRKKSKKSKKSKKN